MKAIWDADYLGYKVSFAMEERYVEYNGVRWNNRSEVIQKMKNEFGEEEWNDEYLKIKEDIKDVQQQIGSERKAYAIVDSMIKRINREVGASSYEMFLEGNANDGALPLFRWEKAELAEYKGNRKGTIRPLLKESVKEYIIVNHPSKICIDGYEADDHVVMESYSLSKRHIDNIVIATDKDIRGCPVKWYNPDNHTSGDSRCFGELLYDGNKVSGWGRMWFYYQWLAGDPVDNYKPNCFSDVRWGSVRAYTALKHCSNDKEALTAGKDVYKKLYPEPKTITGWRGDEIVIDYKYVASEMWDMARMVRWEGDDVSLLDVWDKFGILNE